MQAVKPASRKHWGQSIWMEFRLLEYGATILTVPPFWEKIVRLYWYLISACINLWSVPEVTWLSTSIKNKPERPWGYSKKVQRLVTSLASSRKNRGWWQEELKRVGGFGKVGGNREGGGSGQIWKTKVFLGRRRNVSRRLGEKGCLSKVWWLFLHRSRYRHAFARIEAPCFGLASTMCSQRRWSKLDREYSFTMCCPRQ